MRVRAFGACGQDLQQRRSPPYNFTFRIFSSSRPLSLYTRRPLLSLCFTCSCALASHLGPPLVTTSWFLRGQISRPPSHVVVSHSSSQLPSFASTCLMALVTTRARFVAPTTASDILGLEIAGVSE